MFNLEELKLINKIILDSNIKLNDLTSVDNLYDKINLEISKIKSCNQNVYSFYWDCGRQGEVEGVFKATQDEVDRAIGCSVYFGEILGKHSEVYGTIDDGEIELISDDPSVVINYQESGYNPLDYIDDVDYHIYGLTKEQLILFAKCYDTKLEDKDTEYMRQELKDYICGYCGYDSESLASARSYALNGGEW